jgi:hypothetical protein
MLTSQGAKRALASRPSGEWKDEDYDVLADTVVGGARRAEWYALDVDARLRAPRGPHADARLRSDARSRNGGVRQKLAAELATSILPSLNGKTTRSWRGIVSSTRLAREGA